MESPRVQDPRLRTASLALQRGEPLAALGQMAGRDDAHAMAVRGIALAQLGELARARGQLTAAVKLFQDGGETLWAAKALAALAETCFASRDLDVASLHLDSTPLREAGDHASATYVDIQRARLYSLTGRVDAARRILEGARGAGIPVDAATNDAYAPHGKSQLSDLSTPAAQLAHAELLATLGQFRAATQLARDVRTMNPLLMGEAKRLAHDLTRPAFPFHVGTAERRLSLVEVEALTIPYVDTVRRLFGDLDLRRRTTQLELLASFARGPVTTKSLFGRTNESLMARLRMEISRLRKDTGLEIVATEEGFVTTPIGLLMPEGGDAPVALLADGEAWAPRALAAVLGESVRTVERRLKDQPGVAAEGQGRARRYRLRDGHAATATRLLLLTRARRT